MITIISKVKTMLLAAMMPWCVGCNEEAPQEMYFIGDSLIARWDLQENFPFWVTHNDGVSGAHIDYIERKAGAFTGRPVVVLIGTNDLAWLDPEELTEYCQRYMSAVKKLQARHTYLLSVPPRQYAGDPLYLNELIRSANRQIRQLCTADASITYINIYDALERDGTLNMEYSYDGVHFNSYGYDVVTDIIMDNID